MNKQTAADTSDYFAPHHTERRIRFGSDGNGVFVAINIAGPGKKPTWQIVEDPKALLPEFHPFAHVLSPADLAAARAHFE
jgi:hypothetical protein